MDSSRGFVIFIAFIAALCGLLFGYDTGVISGALLYITHDFALTHVQAEWVVSAVLVGAMLGAILAGNMADRWGRRRMIIITSMIFIAGSAATACAISVPAIIMGRMVLGIAIGIASFTAPLYIAEIAPYQYRGSLISLNQLAITIGIVASYFVDYFLADSTHTWRTMFAVGIIPAAILLVGMIFLPESPRWMILHGFIAKARKVLRRIRTEREIQQEITQIENSIQKAPNKRQHWKLLFARWVRPVIFLGLGLGIIQQFTGINTIIYYSPIIFKAAGFTSSKYAILATAIVGTVQVAFTLFAVPFVDKIGRRPLLFIGLSGMMLGLMGLSFAFHTSSHFFIVVHSKWLTLTCVLLYVACYAISSGMIVWVMFAEIFPLEVRGIGMSLVTAAQWFFNLFVSVSFLTMVDWFSMSGTFLFYAAVCGGSLLFVSWFVPETKGVTLEYIEANLRLGKQTRDIGIAVNAS